MRHLAVADLWVQQKAQRGELDIRKIDGAVNTADLMTKSLDRARIELLASLMGMGTPVDDTTRELSRMRAQHGDDGADAGDDQAVEGERYQAHGAPDSLATVGECRDVATSRTDISPCIAFFVSRFSRGITDIPSQSLVERACNWRGSSVAFV